MSDLIVISDRTRIESLQCCARFRWLTHEMDGRGLDLDREALNLNVGSCVHVGVEDIVKAAWRLPGHALDLSHDQLLVEGILSAQAAPEYAYLPEGEPRDLVDALVRTWWAVGLPALAGWEVLSVEKEEKYDYQVGTKSSLCPRGSHTDEINTCPDVCPSCHGTNYVVGSQAVRLLSRSDWIARAPAARKVYQEHDVEIFESLALNGLPVAPGLYNWNLKTARECGDQGREAPFYDAQTMTELFGPEARMGERFAGVIYQVLIKEDHPLVWAWRSAKTGETVARYRWNCDSAHENLHTKAGGWCPGGKMHRLGGDFTRRRVADLPGGMAAWFDKVRVEDPSLLSDFHVILGPIMRPSDYVMDEWKEMWLPREAALRAARDAILAAQARGDEARAERLLRQHFPKETANRNCVRYRRRVDGTMQGGCPALGICWGGESAESYDFRTPNHPEALDA
mgnify:CR=1 FL=1